MIRWWRRIGVWCAIAVLAAACGGGDGPTADTDLAAVPTFEGTVNLEIGEFEGDDAYLFSRIPRWRQIRGAGFSSSTGG